MQAVTNLAFQVTAIHPVIGFQVTDDGSDGKRSINPILVD
jgi:hypothetical protein